jgi:FMNH2-dependent dimethyl sulfone monooxygenase
MSRGADARSPADHPGSPLSRVLEQPLILGLFLPVYDGGWSPSTAARTTTWTYEYNQALALRAEQLGFDLLFGPSEWVGPGGYGGEMRFRENSIDPFIATAALSSVTHRILLISTLHVLYAWHPLNLARFGATLDHISGGRWGINVVTGHSVREAAMFGRHRPEHDLRYEMADEFVGIMKALWQRHGGLDHEGRFWQLQNAFVSPEPRHGRPILVSATGSPAGAAFAGRHSDIVFITSPAGARLENALAALPDHVRAIKAHGAANGRKLRTLINPMIICRDTEAEAREYHDHIVRHADPEAVQNYFNHFAMADSKAWGKHDLQGRIVGGNVQLIGSPEQVADGLIRLSRAGCDGVQVSFFDFQPDLEFFGARVLPLLKEAGLRGRVAQVNEALVSA